MYAALNPFNVTSQHIAHPVHTVYGLVYEYAAAFSVPGAFPVTSFIISVRAVPGEIGAGREDASEISGVYECFQLFHTFCIPGLEYNAELSAGTLLCLYHPVCILQGDSHRLFCQHMKSGLHGLYCHDRVQIMGKAQVDDINIILEGSLQVSTVMAVKFLCKSLCFFLVNIYGAYKLHLIRETVKGVLVADGNSAAAHNCSSEFFHFIPPFYMRRQRIFIR